MKTLDLPDKNFKAKKLLLKIQRLADLIKKKLIIQIYAI